VERNLQVLGVRRWRELVTDREKWTDIVRQAKAHNGLKRQWKKRKNKISNLIKIRKVGAELYDADGQTDMTKLTVAFRNFAKAPDNIPTPNFLTITL